MVIKYTFLPWDKRAVEMEYFCRGAVAMDSIDFDWSSSTVTNLLSIYTTSDRMKEKIEATFGPANQIVLPSTTPA